MFSSPARPTRSSSSRSRADLQTTACGGPTTRGRGAYAAADLLDNAAELVLSLLREYHVADVDLGVGGRKETRKLPRGSCDWHGTAELRGGLTQLRLIDELRNSWANLPWPLRAAWEATCIEMAMNRSSSPSA